jgi:Flp pilus assembly protein TadG
MKRMPPDGGRRAGHSLIEFSLMLPLLLLLVVNVVNFGAFMYGWITVSNAARAGAQYMILGPASYTSPKPIDSSAIAALITNDVSTLLNKASVLVRVCTNNGGTYHKTMALSETGSACAAGNTNGLSDPEVAGSPALYVLALVDVSYTYQPIIPLWEFSLLHIHATLPPSTIHKTAVMRMIE